MPERIVAVFADRPAERDRLRLALRDAGLFESLGQPLPADTLLHKIELPNEDVVRRLTFAVAAHGIAPPLIQRYMAPSATELAAAPLLLLRAGGAGVNRAHPRAGTDYDDSRACPQCGAGLAQASPLVVRKTELPKAGLAAGVGDELLLHESVAAAVETMAGLSLRRVIDPGGAPVPWFQLVVETTLPPMLASSRGLIRGRAGAERPCGRCGRDGWFDTMTDPFIPSYPRAMLDAMPDAAWTFELFGTGAWADPIHGTRSLASRRLIVKPRVYAALKPLKLRGLRWFPVRVE